MSYTPVNPYRELTQHQIFQLFWFCKMVIHHENPDFDYLRDFHVTETLIQSFNSAMSTMPDDEGETRQYLSESGLQYVDDADVKNVLMSIQVSLGVREVDATCLGDANIRQAVAYYLEWVNYFNYMYAVDYRFQAKPVIWNISRKHTSYTIMQIERGAIMEKFIDNEFKRWGIDIGFFYSPFSQSCGESRLGLEIKHDMKSKKTGNYYIECYETLGVGKAQLVSSGILKNDNTIFWLIGTLDEYYIVYKEDLRRLYYSLNQRNSCWQNGKRLASNKNSKGFIIDKAKLQEIAIARSVGEFVQKYCWFQRRA